MKLKQHLSKIALSILIVLTISSCRSNNNPSQSSQSETTSEESTSDTSIDITNSYKKAKNIFYKITNIELPDISDLEVKDHPYQEGNTDYLIEIIGGDNLNYQTYLTFENFFKNALGNPSKANPSTGEDNDRFMEWQIIDQWYQVKWDALNKHIDIETKEKIHEPILTESYKKAREHFYQVTNINLPIVYDVYANEDNINDYEFGQTSYQIHLDNGANLNYQTYLVFEEYFKNIFGNVHEGYPIENDGSVVEKWVKDDREYYLSFTLEKHIIIDTNLTSKTMKESYQEGRELFHQIIGIWLIELYDVELLSSSSFDLDNQTALFNIPGDNDLYLTFISYLKGILNKDPIKEEDDTVSWDYIYFENNRNHRLMLDITIDLNNSILSINASLLDYYTVSLSINDDRGTALILNNYESSIITTPNMDLTLFAKPYLGYIFDGWYINNNLISDANPFVFTTNKDDVIIEGRFLIDESKMSDSYQKAREEFYEVSDIILPALDNLEVEEYEYQTGDLNYSFNVIDGTYQIYEIYLSFFDKELSSWEKEELEVTGDSKRVIYTSIYNDQLELNYDSENKTIYINIGMSGYYGVNTYNQGRNIISDMFGIDLPYFDDVIIKSNLFKKDGTEVTFAFSNESFNLSTYEEIKETIIEIFDEPTESDTLHSKWMDDQYEVYLSYNEDEKAIAIIINNVH